MIMGTWAGFNWFNPFLHQKKSKVPKNNLRLLHTKDCTGIAQIQIQNAYKWEIAQTGQNAYNNTRHHRPAQFKFKYMSLCSWRHFSTRTNSETVCVTIVHHTAAKVNFLYICGSQHKLPFDAQQQEVLLEVPISSSNHICSHICNVIDYLFHNPLLDFIRRCLVCCACI